MPGVVQTIPKAELAFVSSSQMEPWYKVAPKTFVGVSVM
eukprot:g10936.t1